MKELARHIMVDFLPMKEFAEDPLILTEGRGIYVTDVDGRRFIDGLSGTSASTWATATSASRRRRPGRSSGSPWRRRRSGPATGRSSS